MSHLSRLGSQLSIPIPRDADGTIGRECPVPECESYFKIQPGTGLKGSDLPCHCPYCGHKAGHDKFFTPAQIDYAKSVAVHQMTGAMLKDFKTLEFNHRPRGAFGIGISMTVTGRPTPIRHYREKKLETEVICDKCTLRYMIYGVFGFCPDCGGHNSLQILKKNFELVEKLLTVAETQESAVAQHLIENALEDCVSAFDGFGRETCRVFSAKALNPRKTVEIRFQSVTSARERVKEQFNVDFAATTRTEDWVHAQRAFQKRHLLAHKMGVIDDDYIAATAESSMLVGRKVSISAKEVQDLVVRLGVLSEELFHLLENKA